MEHIYHRYHFRHSLFCTLILAGTAVLAQSGSADTQFTPGDGPSGAVGAVAVATTGKIYIGGFFSAYDGVERQRFARLLADGTLDQSFTVGTGFNQYTWDIEPLADGDVLVAGEFWTYQGTTVNGLVRLNNDGTRDAAFNVGAGFQNSIGNGRGYSIAVQPDGKVIAGGSFTRYQGVTSNYLVRINTDGTRDASFDIGTGFNNDVWAVELLPNGQLMVGGDFSGMDGVATGQVVRLNADGSLDESFSIGTGAGFAGSSQFTGRKVAALAVQPDGKVLVGGDFVTLDGNPQNHLARLNADGSFDGTFDIGDGASALVSDIVLQPDGKLFIAGDFEYYNTAYVLSGLAEVDLDGGSLIFGEVESGEQGIFGVSNALALQPDGKLLLAGEFLYYDNTVELNNLMRFNTDATTQVIENGTSMLACWPVPTSDRITIDLADDHPTQLQLHSMDGRLVLEQRAQGTTVLDLSPILEGAYLLQARRSDGTSRIARVVKR